MENLQFTKPKSFFFHYNRPASQKKGIPMMSVHVDKKCHIIPLVDCQVACSTRVRKTQPRVVMGGKCSGIHFTEDKITLV